MTITRLRMSTGSKLITFTCAIGEIVEIYWFKIKATQGKALKIILTKNEVELSRRPEKKMVLFDVHCI